MDLRLTKEIRLGGTREGALIGEVFNLFNRANYGSYNTSLSATNAAHDRAVRRAGAEHRQRLRAAAGAAGVQVRVLGRVSRDDSHSGSGERLD